MVDSNDVKNRHLHANAEHALKHGCSPATPTTSSSAPDVDAATRQTPDQVAMHEFAISHDGRRYLYNGHRYDRLADALDYAKLMRSQPAHEDLPGPFLPSQTMVEPTDADREVMASLGINFKVGVYEFQGFHYDHLADAVVYARSR